FDRVGDDHRRAAPIPAASSGQIDRGHRSDAAVAAPAPHHPLLRLLILLRLARARHPTYEPLNRRGRGANDGRLAVPIAGAVGANEGEGLRIPPGDAEAQPPLESLQVAILKVEVAA